MFFKNENKIGFITLPDFYQKSSVENILQESWRYKRPVLLLTEPLGRERLVLLMQHECSFHNGLRVYIASNKCSWSLYKITIKGKQ